MNFEVHPLCTCVLAVVEIPKFGKIVIIDSKKEKEKKRKKTDNSQKEEATKQNKTKQNEQNKFKQSPNTILL